MDMNRETIVFDLDDVLIKDAFFGILNAFTKEYLGREITKEELNNEYYYERAVFGDVNDLENVSIIRQFHNFVLQYDMYDYGMIEDGAIELLKKLSETHNVVIFTSPILEGRERESGILFKNKYEALCKIFPFIPPENFILGRNKSIISAKYMVDDRVDNLTGNIDVKMLYSAKHNLEITDEELFERGIFRVSSMEEIGKVVYSEF